ncbi:MAG TPA: hypothetical protein EYN79_07435 [Planctomycetes bacterium]|nr:hypothetical protein [Planctomycetota bacterium]HIN80252.1 hypothetical protein [Planctomycetota bacterium]
MTSLKHLVSFLLLLSLVTLAGCARSERVESATIPLSWQGRDLFGLDGQWAFATKAAEADEVISLAADAGEAFERIEGRPRGKLLLVARGPDSGDKEEILAALTGLAQLMGQPQDKLEKGVLKRFGTAEAKVTNEAGELPGDIEEVLPMLRMVPGTIPGPPNWTSFPIAGESSQVIVLPTSKCISEALDWAVDRAMEKEEFSGLGRLLVSPIVALVKVIARGFVSDFCRATVYGAHCWSVPEWGPEEREIAVRRYLEELGMEEKLELSLP